MKKMFLFQVVFLTATLNAIEPDNFLSLKDYVEPVQVQVVQEEQQVISQQIDNVEVVDEEVQRKNIKDEIVHEKDVIKGVSEEKEKTLKEATVKEKVSAILGDLKEKLDKSKAK